jgi:hypothetical protein
MRINRAFIGCFVASSASLNLLSSSLAQLPPETIQINILKDEAFRGEATLSGLIRLGDTDSRTFTATGNNWLFRVTINTVGVLDSPFYSLQTEAQYLGEVEQPFLRTPSQNIDDATVIGGAAAGNEVEIAEAVQGEIVTRLNSTLIDLRPDFPSFGLPTGIDGDFARTISAQFTTTRASVPEPTSVLSLLSIGLIGLVATRKVK